MMQDSSFPDALARQYQLHWYVLERVLGQGGFGITYLARDSNLDKLVAIKEYLPVDTATRRADASVAPRSTTQAERYQSGLEGFIREARTLARFNHANIVRVHSVFQHNNTAYMVMEYEEGETLEALLERRKTLPEADLQALLIPILEGLAFVHAEGFLHRDIKPQNILIRKDASPVLLDFGSARSGMGQSRTVTILVAPGYSPFEQYYANGESQGPWTDIYGLGATCYRAITGEPPIDAIARSKGVLGSTREMLTPAAKLGSGRYSARFLAAVDHALAFAERDRPQTLADWKHELMGDAQPASSSPSAAAPAELLATPAQVARAGLREVIAWTALGASLAALAIALWPRAPAPPPERVAQPQPPTLPAPMATQIAAPLPPPVASAPLAPVAIVDAPAAPPIAAKAAVRDAVAVRTGTPARPAAPPAVARPTTATAPLASAAPITAPLLTPQPAAAQPQQAAAVSPSATSTPTPTPVAVAPVAPNPAPVAAPAAATAAQLIPANDKDAFAHYRARALKGDAQAQMQVGEMYAAGKGVGTNHNSAYFWFGLAARSGSSTARTRMGQEAQRLQPAEVRQAERQIESFVKGTE